MQKKITSFIILALCVVVTLATILNVFVDNKEVIAMAEKATCANAAACTRAMTSMQRTPLGQTFTFQGDSKSIEVTCRRAYIAFGDYSCKASE